MKNHILSLLTNIFITPETGIVRRAGLSSSSSEINSTDSFFAIKNPYLHFVKTTISSDLTVEQTF